MSQKIQILERKSKFPNLSKEEILRILIKGMYLYIPLKEEKNILGGKAKIEDIWICPQYISIIFENIPSIFEYRSYKDILKEQEELEIELDGKEAVYVFLN